MPSLRDLFGVTSEALNTTPQRMRNLPPPPREPEWDIRSGLPEPGLGQVTPEEWLPPGMGTKLAALMGKGVVLAGAMRSAAKSGLSHDPAERAAAFLTAQRNAAKPVSEGGLGLRPDNTAQERASAMGFNGEGYHYSRAENEVGELDPLNHPLGVRKMIEERGSTPSDFIGTHVGTKDAAMDRHMGFGEIFGEGVGEKIGATYPVRFKNDLPYGQHEHIMSDSDFSELPLSMYGIGAGDVPSKAKILEMRKDLFSNNSNVPYINEWEDAGNVSHVIPPENIRSQFAAFDPAKRGSSDLLGYADPRLLGMIAGGTGGGIALNKLLQLQAPER